MINSIYRPKIVHRKRIEVILDRIFDVPIFFVCASMGYGKTTAVKNFLDKKKNIEVVWFNGANEENDDVWMWHKFGDSLKKSNLKMSERLINCGIPKSNMDNRRIIEAIREEMHNKTVLVIDDWDYKRTVFIKSLLKAIAFEGIKDLHIVLISRNRPENEYIELELKQKCIIVGQDDISFTFDETVEFFNTNGIELSEKEKHEVYEYTGGWTSATYLALLQYYEEHNFKDIPKATQLIKTAVYDKFDETTKKIILKLSLVNNFTLEQAIYITEDDSCNLIIKKLVENNCFIKYDRKSKLYNLHSILKTALEEEILYSDVDFYKVNNAAGDWYSKNNEDIQAIEYYYKAQNFQRILDLIERNYTINLTRLWGRIINSVFKELSFEEKIARPIAYLTYLFFYIVYEDAMIGKELLNQVKEIYIKNKIMKDKKHILGEIAFLESLLTLNDAKKMIFYHKKAYELFEGGISRIANNRMPISLGSPHFLCLYHNQKGKLKDIVKCFEEEIRYFVHISNGGASGVKYLVVAEYSFEIGDVYNGELFAYKALHKAKSKNQTSIIICSLFLLMRISINRNDNFEIRNKLHNLIKEYGNMDIPSFLNGAEIALEYINGITGNIEATDKWTKEVPKNFMRIISPNVKMRYVICGLTMIGKKNYIELEVQAETMLEAYENSNKNIFGIIYSYIFDSIAKYNLYGIEKAQKSLLKAIELAKEDNIIMTFVELAPHIVHILKTLKKDEFTNVLLKKCEKFNEIYFHEYVAEKKIELTPRELEVIKLVEEGYKQREISDKLHIALITVKKHIASVYLKLNVKNKIMAINILKDNGII
ncbi:LuxR C-terminal-related transcriptional regulator [Clostridium sp. C2-6-12]|uniref:helix-turn-helix transcriptional regulator n=1 Tax=Clostridium sp. C2-6-12 TaxID=2698832 RepID=UPI00136FA77B|nr:LuxR C-terminal-related transcriptional regulator [Clostridium sp. C2-6-12]